MLDDIRDFALVLIVEGRKLFVRAGIVGNEWYDGGAAWAGGLYCPACGDVRRAILEALYFPFKGETKGLVPRKFTPPLPRSAFPDDQAFAEHSRKEMEEEIAHTLNQLVPSVFLLTCGQCETKFTAVIYQGPDGPALLVLPSARGGITTPHTPSAVAYYLDQAHRAKILGAYTAAVAMFRAALEALLQEQGYAARMLGPKLAELEAAIAAKTAPQWAVELDTDFLKVIKDLGNASIHVSDSDIAKQAALDADLVSRVNQTLQMLLYLVYEVPHKKAETLDALKAKAQALKK
jgi:hypothetical protein